MNFPYQKKILENGLRLITVPMKVPSVTVLLLVGAGSRYEKLEQNGLSHFLEHMAFKGTKKRPSTLQISSEIEGVGGVFNAFTSKDHTGYWIKAAAQHLPLLVEILADILLNSLFLQEEIEREKGVIIEEINLYEDTPIKKIGEEYERLLYGRTPLGRGIAGRKEIIRKLCREDFLEYRRRLYAPNNCVLVVAGGVGDKKEATVSSLSAVSELAREYLGGWRKGEVISFKKLKERQSAPQVRVLRKKTEQAHLCLGVRAINLTDPRRYAMSLLTVILGGGMSSRLFQEVREKRGLAYYIKSETNRYQDVGNFVTQAGVDVKKIEEAVEVILWEYHKLKGQRAKLKTEELRRAKEFVKGSLILSLENSKAVASLYGGAELLEGKMRTPSEIIKGIEAVTAEEVAALAGEIFKTEKLNLAVIGSFRKDEEERLGRLLRL